MLDHRPDPIRGLLAACACLIGTSAVAVAADPPAPPAVLHLSNGGFASGTLGDSAAPGVLRWQSPIFAGPFEFAMKGVENVSWPPPADPAKAAGASCIELAGGDVLFGSLVDLDDKAAVLDVARLGKVRIDRSSLRRISLWRDGADLTYVGPINLAGWKEPSGLKEWREESGQAVTDKPGASLRADLGMPDRASIEFEVSWKTTPDFVLAFGVGADDATARQAWRFEVWEGNLIVVRESKKEADLAPLQPVAGPGRAHFQLYLDQVSGRIAVLSNSGTLLADLTVPPPKLQPLTGVYLANNRGDVRLERLRVGKWTGPIPQEIADGSRLRTADGSLVAGQVARLDAQAKEFVVREGDKEARIAADRATDLTFPHAGAGPPRSIRVLYQDGTRISGDLIKIEGGDVWLNVPGIEGPTRLTAGGMRSLVMLTPEAIPASKKEEGAGRLELEGLRLPGRLAENRDPAQAGRLAWLPDGGAAPALLRPEASGRVVYKEPPPKVAQPQQPVQRGGIVQGLFSAITTNPPAQAKSSGKRALHLRTGDVIPAEFTKIDEEGVSFKTPLSDSTFVPHAKVKAVELASEYPVTIKINKSKRERLLTLPRVQRDSPPTQLIRSRNGDYLRGRVVAMDDKTLKVEARLDTKDVPRDRIAQIIWLHPDELDPAKATPPPASPTAARVQALRSDGIRLTFLADRMADATLSGKSEVLGACRVKLDEVEQILLGGEIEKAAAQLAYQRWKLKNAVEPKFATGDGGPTSKGTEAAMVGKLAPDFTLDLLGGNKFHLADSKGKKVVLLDFWATWCGPCLQAMPQVEKVADEFKDQGVQLIAVNLQEAPEQIKSMMERHKLHPTVALDRDGVVAERYGANAIPQTVIIDREGKVARLFIGGGPHLDDQLREALKEVLSAKVTQ